MQAISERLDTLYLVTSFPIGRGQFRIWSKTQERRAMEEIFVEEWHVSKDIFIKLKRLDEHCLLLEHKLG